MSDLVTLEDGREGTLVSNPAGSFVVLETPERPATERRHSYRTIVANVEQV